MYVRIAGYRGSARETGCDVRRAGGGGRGGDSARVYIISISLSPVSQVSPRCGGELSWKHHVAPTCQCVWCYAAILVVRICSVIDLDTSCQ